MYNNKFKYDVKFTAEDKKVFFGGGLSPFHPFENSSLRYSFIFPFKIILSFNLPSPHPPWKLNKFSVRCVRIFSGTTQRSHDRIS